MAKAAKIAKEVAEQEFERFLEAMDLEFDVKEMDEDDKAGFQKEKDLVVKEIIKGNMSINDSGEPVYIDGLTFHEPTGASFMAMDRRKSGETMAKQYAMLAEMTQSSPKTFANMKWKHLRVCLAVQALFLA
jgi:hypothetical protein